MHFIGHEISNGRFPVYDPYIYSGLPLAINTQAALLYPVHLLFFGIIVLCRLEPTHSLINGLGVLHFIIGGICFYFLARHFGIRRTLAGAGAILYSMNGHILAQSQHLGVIKRNYRGWEITVDGRRVEPVTVNELLMGIPITQGQHSVMLRFRMPYRDLIIALTALGILLTAALLYVRGASKPSGITSR